MVERNESLEEMLPKGRTGAGLRKGTLWSMKVRGTMSSFQSSSSSSESLTMLGKGEVGPTPLSSIPQDNGHNENTDQKVGTEKPSTPIAPRCHSITSKSNAIATDVMDKAQAENVKNDDNSNREIATERGGKSEDEIDNDTDDDDDELRDWRTTAEKAIDEQRAQRWHDVRFKER